jgi:hypothetical protein
LAENEIASLSSHDSKAFRVGKELKQLGCEALDGTLGNEVAVEAGSDGFAESPGVGDQAWELVKHGFQRRNSERLVERRQHEERGILEE